MNHSLYPGFVWHKRELPKNHEFKNLVYTWAVDIDTLSSLNQLWPLCGYNRGAIFSIHDKSYLEIGNSSFREKLAKFVSEDKPDKITLLTTPKYFGYVFNPLSVYVCYKSDLISALILEVRNTFGDSHVYLLKHGEASHEKFLAPQFDKEFFVSPFFDISGQYKVALHSLGERLELVVELYKDGQRIFIAHLSGKRLPFTAASIFKCVIRAPLSGWGTMLRIQFQAVILSLFRKLPFHQKAPAKAGYSLRNSATIFDKIRLKIVHFFHNRA